MRRSLASTINAELSLPRDRMVFRNPFTKPHATPNPFATVAANSNDQNASPDAAPNPALAHLEPGFQNIYLTLAESSSTTRLNLKPKPPPEGAPSAAPGDNEQANNHIPLDESNAFVAPVRVT